MFYHDSKTVYDPSNLVAVTLTVFLDFLRNEFDITIFFLFRELALFQQMFGYVIPIPVDMRPQVCKLALKFI